MGVVYSAIDTLLERRVAIKLLPTMAALEPKKLARFQHEAQVVARLSHPHIVPLYSMEADQGLNFLVMQLIDGVSLDRVAASSTAPLSSGSPDGTRILGTVAGSESSGKGDGTNETVGANRLTILVVEHVVPKAAAQPVVSFTALNRVRGGNPSLNCPNRDGSFKTNH